MQAKDNRNGNTDAGLYEKFQIRMSSLLTRATKLFDAMLAVKKQTFL